MNEEGRSARKASSELLGELLEEAALRGGSLGKLGDFLATKALEDNGFKAVCKIGDKDRVVRRNGRTQKISYGSLIASKGSRKYVIAVKTRRKYQKSGKLNERYKLADSRGKRDLYRDAGAAEDHFDAAAHWIAVQIDNGTYFVYFGTLRQLNGKSGIPMRDSNLGEYKCLAYRKKVVDTVDLGEAEGGEIMSNIPVEIIDSLKSFQQDHRDQSKAAFIMMQFGATKAHENIVRGIRSVLGNQGISALRADDREYHADLFSNVLTYIYGCSFGIAVFERIEVEQFNPNVSLEVGYMMALRKPVCLLKDKTLKTLQTDLVGKVYRQFDPQAPEKTIAKALTKWAKDKEIIP